MRSAALVFTPVPEWTIALTASYTQRPPTYVELFASGPHVATNAFEIGDPDLGLEKSFALDLTVRRKLGRVTGSTSVFYYHFQNFITSTPTGLFTEEGLPIFVTRATEVNFFGGELELTFPLIERRAADLPEPTGKSKDAKAVSLPGAPAQPHRLDLTLRTDYVHAEDEGTGRSLLRITPFCSGAELAYAFNERVDGQFSARQNRTAEFEFPTDSFFLLNAGLSYKVPVRGRNSISTCAAPTSRTTRRACIPPFSRSSRRAGFCARTFPAGR